MQGLRKAGYESIALLDPKVAHIFERLTVYYGFYASKDFLPVVSMGSKPGECWAGRLYCANLFYAPTCNLKSQGYYKLLYFAWCALCRV